MTPTPQANSLAHNVFDSDASRPKTPVTIPGDGVVVAFQESPKGKP
jgi:hypothetical protein